MLFPSMSDDVSVDTGSVSLLAGFAPGRNCQIIIHCQSIRLKGCNLTGLLHYNGFCAFDTPDKP
jgi:hypothetical protein